MAASLLLLPPLQPFSNLSSSSPTLLFHQNTHQIPSLTSLKFSLNKKPISLRPLTVPFALTESESSSSSSDSPESLDPQNPETLLQELAGSFALPPDYFAQLPNDLRLDLNDAAFDLSSGLVIDECGQELGTTLLNLARAWESADTSTSSNLASKLPSLVGSLTDNAKSALGKRLVASGRRFQSMGQYGQGELQRIAKSMVKIGKLLSTRPVSTPTEENPIVEARMLKFGDLQVELTSDKANIGAIIGLVFGIISWEASQGIQSIPEGSMQYANDNALMLAKSLRGALLAIFYSSTILSIFTSVGLVFLGRQLKSKTKEVVRWRFASSPGVFLSSANALILEPQPKTISTIAPNNGQEWEMCSLLKVFFLFSREARRRGFSNFLVEINERAWFKGFLKCYPLAEMDRSDEEMWRLAGLYH